MYAKNLDSLRRSLFEGRWLLAPVSSVSSVGAITHDLDCSSSYVTALYISTNLGVYSAFTGPDTSLRLVHTASYMAYQAGPLLKPISKSSTLESVKLLKAHNDSSQARLCRPCDAKALAAREALTWRFS
ncbi:hypothetical protein M8818_006848 [Zalaria obscura]|uniref:Uncharacterized protein n=1 Tax=Zalaria obscura TaxID=2024903 RepID=A0ACC3S524_9PEZI